MAQRDERLSKWRCECGLSFILGKSLFILLQFMHSFIMSYNIISQENYSRHYWLSRQLALTIQLIPVVSTSYRLSQRLVLTTGLS